MYQRRFYNDGDPNQGGGPGTGGGRGAGGGMGGGQGRGMGQGGGRGRGPGGGGAGPGGTCVCVRCGHQEPHRRGTPCNQMQCPKCGSYMTRQG